ncbi:hypothetical protein [Kribbella antibiotica]|nr:hypothetical protein [Kribbella antibiotica]
MTDMVWIGGSPGAGKSTISRQLAKARDLPLHPVDLWTYDHLGRMPVFRSLVEEVAETPEAAADVFVKISRARLDVVVEDVTARDLGRVPALVEGPQLFPSLLTADVRTAIWLVADGEQTRKAREERLEGVDDAAARARLEGLLERDAILAGRVREEAAAAGLPLVEVSADPDWAAIMAMVETTLGQLPRLRPGDELSRQRRIENRAACRQVRLWRSDRGFAELPRFPFACECGESGCALTFVGTPDEYEARADVQLRADGHLNHH